MLNWQIKKRAEENIDINISVCNHVSALKTYERAKSKNSTEDILSLLVYYLRFKLTKCWGLRFSKTTKKYENECVSICKNQCYKSEKVIY